MEATSNSKPPVYLVDGPSLLYRAFYALPLELASSAGMPTNAIFGFVSMLVKLIAGHGAARGFVAWDRGSSGRAERYEPYKANRRARPPELAQQWPVAEELAEVLGFRNVALEGYEADDVIATLARKAREGEPPVEAVVVTGDRDALQLVDGEGRVKVLATTRGLTDTKLYDRAAVEERFGVPPELIPDLYGLKGDSSDNIPGVPGIGEKTAAALLQRFGSLEEVLAHAEEVGGAKRKEALLAFADQARLSRELAKARDDLPLAVTPQEAEVVVPDLAEVQRRFAAYELRAPLRRLQEALGQTDGGKPAQRPAEGEEVELERLAAALGEGEWALAVRREGEEQLFGERSVSYAFASLDGERLLTGTAPSVEAVVEAAAASRLVVHGAKGLGAVPPRLAFDTMLAGYLLEPSRRRYPLGELCAAAEISVEGEGAAADALRVKGLAGWQRAKLQEHGLQEVLERIELPLVGILREMERVGIRLDVAALVEVGKAVREELARLEAKIHKLAGEPFLISSPQQLARILFDKLGLPRKRRGKTGYSTDARVLQSIREAHPIVPLIERYRELATLVKTYLDVLPKLIDDRSRLHTTFVQTSAQTGRLSSTNPNLQNIPVRTELGRRIRRCFCAEEGWLLISADYSQIELRVLAWAAGEAALAEIFARGGDVHAATAAEVFGVRLEEVDERLRGKAKMVNYGIIYGLSDFGLADRLNIPREEARAFIDAYFRRFPAVARFIEETVERARREGYVRTAFGRWRPIPELASKSQQQRALGERLAVNTVVQGTAADIIKLAMISCAEGLRARQLQTRLLLTIHDELLFEAPPEEVEEAKGLIEEAMLGVWPHQPGLAVEVGVGENWLEAK